MRSEHKIDLNMKLSSLCYILNEIYKSPTHWKDIYSDFNALR